MFIYHFVDPDLRVEIFFEKEGAAENRSIDFEIRHIGTSAHLYWRLKSISCSACFGNKKQLLKALLTYNSEWRKRIHTKTVADVPRGAGGGFSCFPGETRRGQQETVVCSKTVLEDLNIKFRSKFNHGFTRCGYLHSAILKVTVLRKKEPTRQQIQNVQNLSNCQNEVFKIL